MSFESPEDYKFVYKIEGCEHKSDFDIDYYIDKRRQQALEALDRLVQALYSDNSYYKRFSDSYGMIMKDYNLVKNFIEEKKS